MIGQRGGSGPAQRGALGTGLRTLELLVSAHLPMGVTDIAEELGIDKANAHRTLAALVRLGYVEQEPSTRRYGATVRVVELARSILDSKDLTVVAAPHLKSLWAASRENTHLAVLAGDHVVYVSTLNGMTLLSANAAIGQSGPLHCTATGKALIANLPRGNAEGLISSLDFEAFTPRTTTSAKALQQELAQIRVTGYAVDDREYHPGVRCIAAPVFGIGGVIASLGISAPADRLDADRLRVLAPIVVDTAARVSRELGGPASRAAS
ncbi:MAG TPA: IclR family transcriptional regulator [Candidatus Limnocylindrales bacterium]|nr:IclR family transcriptional regulator [Candidatus Limnocylindrales bacterium]